MSAKNSSRKKVLHIITGLEVGGAETNLTRILPKLENSFESRVCCLMNDGPMGQEIRNANIRLDCLNISSMREFLNPKIIMHFRRIIKEYQPDIISTHLIHADLFGRFWGKIFGVKKIVCNHRGSLLKWEWLTFFDRLTSFIVTKYIFQTRAAQKEISAKLRIPSGKTTVIPNTIDATLFEKNIDVTKKKQELGINTANLNITVVANLRKGKGHPYLIRAFSALHENKHRDINLLIAGDGEQRPILEHLATASGCSDNIYFFGKRSDIPDILKVTDIFILPTFYEGMSNAILEAMASGLPVITTNINVNKDLIENDQTGLLVPPGNSRAIVKMLNFLISSPDKRTRIGQAARDIIHNNYSPDIVSKQIIQSFNTL